MHEGAMGGQFNTSRDAVETELQTLNPEERDTYEALCKKLAEAGLPRRESDGQFAQRVQTHMGDPRYPDLSGPEVAIIAKLAEAEAVRAGGAEISAEEKTAIAGLPRLIAELRGKDVKLDDLEKLPPAIQAKKILEITRSLDADPENPLLDTEDKNQLNLLARKAV